jgi:DNA-binding NarL/FixJ family response regulator
VVGRTNRKALEAWDSHGHAYLILSYNRLGITPECAVAWRVIFYSWSNSARREMKVFIADDSPPVVERLADLLRGLPGVEFAGDAGDVPAVLRCVRQLQPDALILDLEMPGGSGLDVLRAVRHDLPDLQVLICTNYPYPQYRRECLAAGANYFLDKSAEFDKIPLILRDLMGAPAKVPAR